MAREIVRDRTPEEEELARKQAELEALETELAERELDLATLLSELHVFERRYLRLVGTKYAELDNLRAQIAEAQASAVPGDREADDAAAEARRQANESAQASSKAELAPPEEAAAPSERLKALYRSAAKAVHPDLANDESDRATRTRLMSEVNRAYEERDEDRLKALIREWEASPDAVSGEGPGAELVRVIRKIAQVRSRLPTIEEEFGRIKESAMCQLRSTVEEAESEGRHLLDDMAAAVDAEIAAAKNELSEVMRAGS